MGSSLPPPTYTHHDRFSSLQAPPPSPTYYTVTCSKEVFLLHFPFSCLILYALVFLCRFVSSKRKVCTPWLWAFLGLFVLRFYGPVNPMGSCRARSVYLTTRLLGRLSPLSGLLCTFFRQKLTTALLESAEGRKYFMINLHERMLPTSAGVEPATSWSPVGRRIQLSHRGRQAFLGIYTFILFTSIVHGQLWYPTIVI